MDAVGRDNEAGRDRVAVLKRRRCAAIAVLGRGRLGSNADALLAPMQRNAGGLDAADELVTDSGAVDAQGGEVVLRAAAVAETAPARRRIG